MNQYQYTVEKLTNAIRCLATNPNDVRNRLICAHDILKDLNKNDFPHRLRSEWCLIEEELKTYDPQKKRINENITRQSAEETKTRIRSKDAAKTAERIWKLYFDLSKNP